MKPNELTPNQAAAYVNGAAVYALGELLSKHWANQIAMLEGKKPPHPPADFLFTINRHCINHLDMVSMFDLQRRRED